jgi:hypothetical protein
LLRFSRVRVAPMRLSLRAATGRASLRPSGLVSEHAVNPSLGAPGAASMPRTGSQTNPEGRSEALVALARIGAVAAHTAPAAQLVRQPIALR